MKTDSVSFIPLSDTKSNSSKSKDASSTLFSNMLNSYLLSADAQSAAEDMELCTMQMNYTTLRCLLGSVNLPEDSSMPYVDLSKELLNTYGINTNNSITKDYQQAARDITRLYEGGGIAGNFDGQGLSLGYLQWNIGSGTLQPLLKEMSYDNDFNEIFSGRINYKDTNGNYVQKTMADVLRDVLTLPEDEQLRWAKSINTGSNKISQPWKSAFEQLVNNDKFISIEDKYAQKYFNKAHNIMDSIGVNSSRGFALAFDIAVQNGSLKSPAKLLVEEAMAGKSNILTNPNDPNLSNNDKKIIIDLNNRLQDVSDPGIKKLYYVAAAVAINARDRYAKDVWDRKSTIVSGKGKVHGTTYAFNLSDNILA